MSIPDRTAPPFGALAARWLVVLAALLTASPGCRRAPSQFDAVQEETRRNVPAVSKQAVPGESFNKLFPKAEPAFDVVYTQEKTGFAQAKLVNKKSGLDVATLAVFDTVSNPEAAEKYKATQETFLDYPIIEVGNNGSALLVAGRFQVQIRSTDPSFTKFDREDWFKKFNLADLAKLP